MFFSIRKGGMDWFFTTSLKKIKPHKHCCIDVCGEPGLVSGRCAHAGIVHKGLVHYTPTLVSLKEIRTAGNVS